MIRTRSMISGLAIGASIVLFTRTLVSGVDRGWDSRESRSQLFEGRDSSGSNRAVFTDPHRTALKWAGARAFRVGESSASASTRREGAVLSLTSFRRESSVLTACDPGPDNNQQVASVTNVSYSNSACSSNQVLSNGGQCSVNTTTPRGNPSCSTTAGVSYCSTGPNGTAGGAPGPSLCSVSGGNPDGSVISCSATLLNANDTCSTQGNPNGPASSTCSVIANTQNATCSTGNQASGRPGTQGGGQCSAFTGQLNANQQQSNVCSVQSDGSAQNGTGNLCSTDSESVNPSCSVFTGGLTPPPPISTDTCSVSSSSFTNAACTTKAQNAGQCSAIAAGQIIAGSKQCSVFDGAIFVSGPVKGQCGVTH